MKAIILAGEGDRDIKYFGQSKALTKFKDRPLIEYTIDALIHSGMIDYILVIGNKSALTPVIGDRADKIIEQGDDILDNLIRSISYFDSEKDVMVATCDIPLITSDAIRYFINNALSLKADLCYPIIEKSVCMAGYPDAERTYVVLKEGDFTGGNLIIINPCKIKDMEKQIRTLVNNRKNPLKMAGALGISITVRLFLKRLTIEEIEAHIQKKFNIKGKALIVPYPEISSDIDNIKDIKILEKYI